MEQFQHLSSDEKKLVEERLTYELTDKDFRLLKNASILTFIVAFLPVWAFYNTVPKVYLISWVVTLIIVHIACIALAFYYQHRHPTIAQIKPWRYAARAAIFISTLTWGSMGVLLVPDTAVGQNFVLFFLIVLSSSIVLSTSADYIAAFLGILSLLLPFTIWQFHAGIAQDPLHLQTGAALILYILFLNIFSYISYRAMKNSTGLFFTNLALSEKLINEKQLKELNSELEQRVEIRTKYLKSALTTIKYQASHDDLTGLVNKDELLTEEINSLITLSKETGSYFALVYLTLNNLQEITDTYGIKPDKDVIKEIAQRLRKHLVGHRLMLNRRDTFAILIYPIKTEQMDEELDKITFIIEEPFTLQIDDRSETIFLKASIGVTIYPENGKDAETLKMNTDLTMSYAKQISPERTRYVVCSNDTAERIRRESQLRRDLPKALKKGEFFLTYQPIIDLKQSIICGAEVLVRWQHPTFGTVSPFDFIELAERSGEIIPLGIWILREACIQTKALHERGYNNFKIAVNLSARQLESPTLIEDIKKILNDTKLNPEFLELEMTEIAKFGMDDVEVLEKINALGIDIALDDFGQVQSGLNSLNEFEFIKKIKLDRVFVKNLPNNERSREIVINSMKLAKSLCKEKRNIKVIAEGVEKREQLLFLKDHGVDMVQGYYFSRPISGVEFVKFLQDNKTFNI